MLGLIDIPVLSVLVEDVLLCNPLNRMSTNLFWCRMLCCISHWTECLQTSNTEPKCAVIRSCFSMFACKLQTTAKMLKIDSSLPHFFHFSDLQAIQHVESITQHCSNYSCHFKSLGHTCIQSCAENG